MRSWLRIGLDNWITKGTIHEVKWLLNTCVQVLKSTSFKYNNLLCLTLSPSFTFLHGGDWPSVVGTSYKTYWDNCLCNLSPLLSVLMCQISIIHNYGSSLSSMQMPSLFKVAHLPHMELMPNKQTNIIFIFIWEVHSSLIDNFYHSQMSRRLRYESGWCVRI